jgi:hypothetical protein
MRKEPLEAQIEKVKAELLKLGPMRPGSLSQQYSACQKPGCKCVRPPFVPAVRKQLAAYKKFKALTQQWVTLALELCKLEMQEARSAASPSEPTPRS